MPTPITPVASARGWIEAFPAGMGKDFSHAGWPQHDGRDFKHRVFVATLIVASVAGAALLLWLATNVFLLFFASVLLAIFFRTLTGWVSRFTHLGKGWSFAIVLVALVLLCALAGWLLATPITQQVNELSDELPRSVQQIQNQLEQYPWGRTLVAKAQNPLNAIAQTGGMMKHIQTVFSISMETIIDVLVILFCGFYLAVRPEFYVEGFLRLVPPGRRERGRVVLHEVARELRHWLFGQIVSMTIIGVLTWLGLLLLGIPLSEVLGLLAGLLDFIPVAGPWIAGILSCAVALLKSPMHAVYVACLFVTLHLLEGHLIIPLVQRTATRLPPALTILAMVLFYTLFGFFGLFLATPLLALVMIVTRALYVEDVVERRT